MNWRDYALLQPRTLAEVSGRSLRTIQRHLKSGRIESRFEDGRRLIPIRAALRFVGELQDESPGSHSNPSLAKSRRISSAR